MTREYQYTVVAYDNVGMLAIEYVKEGKPTILRRVPLNLTTPEEELLASVARAAEASAPYDIWDIEDEAVVARLELLQGLIGQVAVAELPPKMIPPDLEPLNVAPPQRSISESDYTLLWEDGLVDIHPDVFFGREVKV